MSGTCVIHGTKAVISSGLPLNTAVACQGECLDSDPVNLLCVQNTITSLRKKCVFINLEKEMYLSFCLDNVIINKLNKGKDKPL